MAEKILEVCKVTPPPMSSNDVCIPLSFFDLIWLRFSPVEVLFFYEASSLPENFLSRLKHSLSLTLQQFLPLSGNLEWPSSSPNPIIRYQKGDGVIFTVAQSDADFCHLSSSRFRETKIFSALLAEITKSDSHVPLLAIKVTLFPNKGFSIGITNHHAAFDAAVHSRFSKSWSSFCKFGESSILESALMFDRDPVREGYPQLENLYINHLLKQDVANPRSLAIMTANSPPDRLRGTFEISTSDINNLKEFVREHEKSNCDPSLTTFTVTLAYIIVCSAKAKDRLEKKMSFDIVVDCRARLNPALSPNYAGNCIGSAGGYVEIYELMGDDGIIAAVNAVQKMRKIMNEGVLKGAETWLEELETDGITIAGSTNMEVYGTDFGLGKPMKVDIASIDTSSAVSLVQGRDGGIQMELSLSKYEMEKFASAFDQGLKKLKHAKAAP